MADLVISPQMQAQSLREVNDEFESRKQDLKSDHEVKMRQIQKAYLKHEQEVRDSGDAAISHIRKDSQKRVESEAGIIQENADQVLARVDSEAKQKVKATQEQGIRSAEGIQKQYSKDIFATQRKGESELKATKDKYDIQHHNDENFYHGQLENEKKQFTEDQQKLDTQYDTKRRETSDLQRRNIQELTKKYNELFVKNEGQNKESINLQKQNFLKEIYRQQQQLLSKANAFESRIDDPFYQARTLDAQLKETEGAYVLTAKIPQPEKNNFDIHVKDDKVVLESYRSNEAKIEGANQKSTTNSYQTHRQEFKLSYPVVSHMMVKQFDEDGNLTVTIPKKDLRPATTI